MRGLDCHVISFGRFMLSFESSSYSYGQRVLADSRYYISKQLFDVRKFDKQLKKSLFDDIVYARSIDLLRVFPPFRFIFLILFLQHWLSRVFNNSGKGEHESFGKEIHADTISRYCGKVFNFEFGFETGFTLTSLC